MMDQFRRFGPLWACDADCRGEIIRISNPIFSSLISFSFLFQFEDCYTETFSAALLGKLFGMTIQDNCMGNKPSQTLAVQRNSKTRNRPFSRLSRKYFDAVTLFIITYSWYKPGVKWQSVKYRVRSVYCCSCWLTTASGDWQYISKNKSLAGDFMCCCGPCWRGYVQLCSWQGTLVRPLHINNTETASQPDHSPIVRPFYNRAA